MKLWPHHERAVASVIPELESDSGVLALVLGGSLAKGWGGEASDIDGHVVITDAAMADCLQRDNLVYKPKGDHCDYEGGYFDFKCVTVALMEEAAEKASEPFRGSFSGATVPWSRVDGLEDLIARITAYPEATHAEKVMQFACHLDGLRWYIGEAAKRDDAYLTMWVTQRVVLFSCRLVLAHNRVLYPYHKWLMRCVREAPEKPEGFIEAVEKAVAAPTVENVQALADLAMGWQDWGKPKEWWNPWIRRTEWAWRYGPVGIDDE